MVWCARSGRSHWHGIKLSQTCCRWAQFIVVRSGLDCMFQYRMWLTRHRNWNGTVSEPHSSLVQPVISYIPIFVFVVSIKAEWGQTYTVEYYILHITMSEDRSLRSNSMIRNARTSSVGGTASCGVHVQSLWVKL